VYLYSIDQICDIVDHHSGGPIFIGPLDIVEFEYEVGNVIAEHNYLMISLLTKENDRVKWNYVPIYVIGVG